jgi:hypothetical protein
MVRRITGGVPGKVIAEAIYKAEITYRDQAGNALFTQEIGLVTSGGTIQRKVPEAEDISIIVEDD